MRTSPFRGAGLGLIALFAIVMSGPVQAGEQVGPAKVLYDLRLNVKPDKVDDYHIKIHNPKGYKNFAVRPLPTTVTFPTVVADPPVPPKDAADLALHFSGRAFEKGTQVQLGLSFDSEANSVRIHESYWTLGNQKIPGAVPIPGFVVQNDPEFTLYNDFDRAMGIGGLQFAVNLPAPGDIDDLYLPEFAGFGSPFEDFVIPAFGSRTFTVANIDALNYAFARATVFDPETSELTGVVVMGHQQPSVPEPGAWALMILGFGAVGSVLRRRRNVGAA